MSITLGVARISSGLALAMALAAPATAAERGTDPATPEQTLQDQAMRDEPGSAQRYRSRRLEGTLLAQERVTEVAPGRYQRRN